MECTEVDPVSSSSDQRSPLAQLVLFMVILSVAGTCVAGAHYYAIDLPEQNAVGGYPPANDNGRSTIEKCNLCDGWCRYSENYYECVKNCELIC